MSKTQVYKECDGEWTVWNRSTGKSAKIIRFEDRFPLLGQVNKRYRVDVNGRTVDSLIVNFQTAKGVAFKHVNDGKISTNF